MHGAKGELRKAEMRQAEKAGHASDDENVRQLFYRAIEQRDERYDGLFYTGVLTTGIYCKPSCPARTPKLENIRFFPTPAAAEKAGLRACLRCKPRAPFADEGSWEKVRAMCALFEEAEETPSLGALAKAAGLSEGHAQKLFRKTLGVTPKQYAGAMKLERFRKASRAGHSVTRAIYEAGYGSSSRFYEKESAALGMRPADYGKKGEGQTIFWTCRRTALGPLLIAGTAKGLCTVRFGESEKKLAASLAEEFSNAALLNADKTAKKGEADARALETWADALTRYAEGLEAWPELPLDIKATAFQAKVWAALRAVPAGKTATYGEIAAAIGLPQSQRAVARACAMNPVALAIPCHRILPKSGGIGGYHWGPERKEKLLDLEKDSPSET